MIKRILKSVREFKKHTIITFILMVGESLIECAIPFLTATLMNKINAGIKLEELLILGAILIAMAIRAFFLPFGLSQNHFIIITYNKTLCLSQLRKYFRFLQCFYKQVEYH